MGRSVSYATGSQVVTFKHLEPVECEHCDENNQIDGKTCAHCEGSGHVEQDEFDFDMLIDDFRDHLKYLFPSVTSCDEWIGNEDHVLAENGLARFGMSEYCGLVSYWIVPKEADYYGPDIEPLAKRWIDSIADKFVAAFGELTKVGSMSNGEGVYRQIRN
jgi:hypothetical protein